MKKTACSILLFLLGGLCHCYSENQPASAQEIGLRFIGSNPVSKKQSLKNVPIKSYFFTRYASSKDKAKHVAKSWYRDIYPGIDMVSYGDEYNIEYIFIMSPGADLSLVRMIFDGPHDLNLGHTGSITYNLIAGKIVQSAPVVFLNKDDSIEQLPGRCTVSRDKTVNFVSDYDRTKGMNGTTFNVIPKDGQPGGPRYRFYMSKFETSNDQFLRFINDAERNLKTPRGENMFFDRLGNIWFNPDMKRGGDEMFSISKSNLKYNPMAPVGSRYSHVKTPDNSKPFANHPVTGVSWYGGVKYCNWLTIESGRGLAERCYTEGEKAVNWAPVTATNWANGTFGTSEKEKWLEYKGFRLPLLNCDAPAISTNEYNEFYKAASWQATTNRIYGFGRDHYDELDANSKLTRSIRMGHQTLPIGFFNGNTFLSKKKTRPNENFYGISDLSGNTAEWMNDPATSGDISRRAVCGGNWNDELTPVSVCRSAPPYSTDAGGGFRPATTYLPSEILIAHMLLSFYMEPFPALTPLPEEEIILVDKRPVEDGAAEGDDKDRFPLDPDTGESATGITYKEGTFPGEVSGALPGIGPPGDGAVLPGGIGPGPPAALVTNSLVVQSSPNQPVNVTVTTNGVSTVSGTPIAATQHLSTQTVQLWAPANDGSGFIFNRWLRNGSPYALTQTTTTLIDLPVVTMVAQYVPPALGVTLGYSPNSSGIPFSSPVYTTGAGVPTWLIALPTGGTGTYTFFYEYKFEHHVSTFANTWWPATNTPFVDSTNLVWFYKDVRFRVTVNDGFSTLLSNEALLDINPTNTPVPPATRVKP